jgi:predicted nucleic acid-binding protein
MNFTVELYNELCHPTAPPLLREWACQPPAWLEVASVNPIDDETFRALGAGERAAITLALSMHANLILIDERKGTKAALNKGLDVVGTLGILRLAAQRGLIDLAACFARLKRTNFRYRQDIIDALPAEWPGND